MTKRWLWRIRATKQIVWFFLFRNVYQVTRETEYDRDRCAFGATHFRQCMKELIDARKEVDNPDSLPRKIDIVLRLFLCHSAVHRSYHPVDHFDHIQDTTATHVWRERPADALVTRRQSHRRVRRGVSDPCPHANHRSVARTQSLSTS